MSSTRNSELEALKATLDWHPAASSDATIPEEPEGTGDIHDIVPPKKLPVAKPRQGGSKPQTGDIHD